MSVHTLAAPAEPGGVAPSDLLHIAEKAVELAQSRPQEARALALSVLRDAKLPKSAGAVAVAERALGQISTLLEDLGSAHEHLSRSIRYARTAGDRHGEAEARLSRAFCLAQEGLFKAAFVELDRAETEMSSSDRDMGRLHNQRALVWWLKGGYEQALPHFSRAAERSRRAADELNLVRVLINRGVVHGRLGSYAAAQRDLLHSEELAARLELPLLAAVIGQNLGWVAAQRGDVPLALRCYDQAERDYQPHCEDLGTLLLDRCDVLLGARLLSEATQTAERALTVFGEGGVATSIPEAQLYLAESTLLAEDASAARAHAQAAVDGFTRQRRAGWTALARYALLRARLLDESFEPAEGRRAALRVAAALDARGLHEQALDVRVVAARMALTAGKVALAKRELAAASSARKRGTVERRARAWHAEALLRLAGGERNRARSAVRAGLRILEEHREMLGATDLRAAASAHRVDLARLGFQMAIEDGRADEALSWVERSRAGLVRLRTARPPHDETLAQLLAQLRATLRDIEVAVRAGEKIAALRARQAQLERKIRDYCRSLPARDDGGPAPAAGVAALAERLGDRALVEYVVHDKSLYALVLVDGRAGVRRLGSAAEVAAAARILSMLLDRVARQLGSPARRQDNLDRLLRQARVIDDLVFAPLAEELGGRELVVVPTGPITSVPWSALPSCGGRPVSIAPSATVWHEAGAAQAPVSATTALVSGPGLPEAEPEVRRLAALYPHAQLLTGADASVARTLSAINGAAFVHIAAHGNFRADNPLFSALWLADGPLTVYDLEGTAVAPRNVVLAACDSARHTTHPGDDLLGLGAAFLSLGTQVLIASLVSLPDGQSTELMIDLHTRLRAGQHPATALAATQQRASTGDPETFAAAAGLVCFGAG